MSNHRRRKSKRSVKCTLCTTHRWKGNAKGRFKTKDEVAKKLAAKEMAEKKS